MTGVYKIVIAGNLVLKYLKKNDAVGKEIHHSLKNNRHWVYFNNIIRHAHKKPYIGKHICKGFQLDMKGYNPKTRGDYCSPLISGVLLSSLNIEELSNKEKFHLIFSIQELLTQLYLYQGNKNQLTGDWTFHNLIWENDSGKIINIDLEGFYTYSNLGPRLSWVKKENKIPFITKNFKQLQRDLLKSIKLSISKLISNIPYLSVIKLPCDTPVDLIFPYKYYNNITNINPYIFGIELGDLQGYKTQSFSVYYLIGNNDKISCLVSSEKINNLPHCFFLFSFIASVEKGYEHPIGVRLVNKLNPRRTVLNFVFDDKECDFYIKNFKDKIN